MKPGDIVKWESDGDAPKTELGQVVSIDDKRVKFKVKDGSVMNVLLTDGKFTVTDEPFEPEPTPAPAKKSARKKKKPPARGTKTERAYDVFRSMPTGTRREIIKAFVDKVGLTPAGAATYYTNCKKRASNE